MKILLDLQGAQCQSRHRGIGRYSLALTKAFADLLPSQHHLTLALNSQLDEAIDPLIAALHPYADKSHRVMIPGLRDIAAQGIGNEARRLAAERIAQHTMEQQGADVVWYSSLIEGYVDDAVLPSARPRGSATVATLYDLIPLHDPAAYLDHPRVRAWYNQRTRALADCDRLLAISDWVREDAIERLDLPPERIVTIGAGVDSRFHPSLPDRSKRELLLRRLGIDAPYVLYNGGFDPRKNLGRLIHAFAMLPMALRDSYRLVIVGRVSEVQDVQLKAAIRRARLDPTRVVFTGFVSDDDLVELYSACALFVFPSLLEGFGLPPLEAMACGAPVIGSDAASLPEVIGDPRALFDPKDPSKIATRMREVLEHPPLADELRKHGLQQAKRFDWSIVAERALQAFDQLSRTTKPAVAPLKPRLLCLLACQHCPAWLQQLGQYYELETRSLAQTNVGQSVVGHSATSARLLYVVEGTSLNSVLPYWRSWPGTLLLTDCVNNNWPAPEPNQLHQLHGYSRHGNRPASVLDTLHLLASEGVGVLLSPGAGGTYTGETDARCILAVLPTLDTADHAYRWIEQWYGTLPTALELPLLDDLAVGPAAQLDPDSLAAVSAAIVAARRSSGRRQWLVDVSEISREDIGTGVQRVARSILREWLQQPPGGIRIEPVAFVDGRYRYAREYAVGLLESALRVEDDWVEVGPDDVFVGLDWAAESLAAREPLLRAWRRRGVSMHFIVHDILPLSLPDAFHPYARNFFKDWLQRVGILSDALHCVSQTTAAALRNWLAQTPLDYQFGQAPHVDAFFLGTSRLPMVPPAGLTDALTGACISRPSLLMVGTLEPRKGHRQALDALEILWARRVQINLLIIGHHGWLMEDLVKRLERHPERDQRLFWLDGADDATLEAVYAKANGLLAASLGEGYGLPLIEAAQRGLPVLARDLPVFREVMGDYPIYFTAANASQLADAILAWLKQPTHRPQHHWPDWKQSATALAQLIQQTTC